MRQMVEVLGRELTDDLQLSGPEDAINASPTDEHPRAAEVCAIACILPLCPHASTFNHAQDVPAQFDDPDAMVIEDVKPVIDNDLETPRPPPRMSFYDLDPLEKLTVRLARVPP